jgi:hypothetical protein
MNFVLIECCLKDSEFISGYLEKLCHHCDWIRKLSAIQPIDDKLSGFNSADGSIEPPLSKYNFALIDSRILNTELGLDIAVKLAKANIIRIGLGGGGVERSKKLINYGVVNFVTNRKTFYTLIDQILAKIGRDEFEGERKKSNNKLIQGGDRCLKRRRNRLGRHAT